ncbi:MAG TPA: GSCFA domain-containing protein [Bacteroidales bacterium]|nr:GSCFA domain-containing protein [Bacteroidales bacterium]
MNLRTTFDIVPFSQKITYNDSVLFVGSCFASAIGSQMIMGRMPVMINPAGVVYNPVSVCNTLDTIIDEHEYGKDDLYCHDGTYLSFNHYTDFSSYDSEKVIEKINRNSREALRFLKNCRFLFITFGTARVYKWKKSGKVVSNCHKIPADQFNFELLTVRDIVNLWEQQLDKLHSIFPKLNIIFTISPVRHWKDGAHGNQISKSILFLAVEELMHHPASPQYFPAYELVMDDLRDYRFYSDDMLHLSTVAINYIWDAFSNCYMEKMTLNLWKEVDKISKACKHRLLAGSIGQINDFADRMLKQIAEVEVKVPSIDLSEERHYFKSLLKK